MDNCANCSNNFTDGSVFSKSNHSLDKSHVQLVNVHFKQDYEELCNACGDDLVTQSVSMLEEEQTLCREFIQRHAIHFPMMTLSHIPSTWDCKIKTMVTVNVAVGTGIFSELSQGLSDFFGVTNVTTGMAHKVNSGEATARSILALKAMDMGANCVMGVDIDYGVTNNNAATVNMQGTAVYISNIEEVLDHPNSEKITALQERYARIKTIDRWFNGVFE